MTKSHNFKMRVGDFSARISRLELPMGLIVNEVKLEGADVFFQKDPLTIEIGSPGLFEAQVTEADLAAFLNKQAPAGLKNIKVAFKDGKVYLDAVKQVIFDVPAKAVCTLRIVDESEVWVDLESVDIMGAGAKNLVQSQIEKINPVLDVKELPIQARFKRLATSEGTVKITGTLAPKTP